MNKLYYILCAVLSILVFTACKESSEASIQTKKAEPKVVFNLPEGWRRFEDNSLYAYAPGTNYLFQDGQSAPGPADLALQYSERDVSIPAAQRRDQAYLEKECQASEQDSEFCVKNLRKDQTQVDNTAVYLLHYDEVTFLRQSVTVAFWDKDGLSNSAMIRGNFQENLPGLVSVVQTLRQE